ncbi:MAG: alanine dehydrogenase, partial [Actinomycetota bacterium]|nr:alanine dehydrogenase [Actinomycetota bacterium]
MILGGGVVGTNAAAVALGLGADVTILDRSLDRLRELDALFAGRCRTVFASALTLEELLPAADLVIGAVLVTGARAPHVIKRGHLAAMKPGAVIVDVSIDQGGCVETSRPTTHSEPTYDVDGITHYCVANMPGALPITSTRALANATLPYLLRLADEGVGNALATDPGFLAGLNVAGGRVTYEPVARAQKLECADPAAAVEEAVASMAAS